MRDYIALNINFEYIHNIGENFAQKLIMNSEKLPVDDGDLLLNYAKLKRTILEKASWHKMCGELLSRHIKKIKSDVYTLEFMQNIYGNILKPISNCLRKIEDVFFAFQNNWYWNKNSEMIDSHEFLKKAAAIIERNSKKIDELLEGYDLKILNPGLKEPYEMYLQMVKIL